MNRRIFLKLVGALPFVGLIKVQEKHPPQAHNAVWTVDWRKGWVMYVDGNTYNKLEKLDLGSCGMNRLKPPEGNTMKDVVDGLSEESEFTNRFLKT